MKTFFLIRALALALTFIFVTDAYGQATTASYFVEYSQQTVESDDFEIISNNAEFESMNLSYDLELFFDAESGFGVSKKQVSTWYDIENELIFSVNSDGRLIDLTALHYVADYRLAEASNRTFLSEMLQNVTDSSSQLFSEVNETILFRHRFNSKDLSTKITQISSGDTLIWMLEDFVLTTYVPGKKGKKGSTTSPEMLLKYLIYELEIHPDIAQEIAQSGILPAYLEFNWSNFGTVFSKKMTYEGKVNTDFATLPNSDNLLWAEDLQDSKWNILLDRNLEALSQKKMFLPKSARIFATSDSLQNVGENLSGLLALFEYLLSTGEQPAEQIGNLIKSCPDDQDVADFLKVLASPANDEEAEAHLVIFNRLLAKTDDFGYVLNVFAANDIQLADEQRALDYFEMALHQSPIITGAYIDVGKIFCQRYEFKTGWKAFLLASRMVPKHPMGTDIERKKMNLKEALPVYF